ncbi:MAG: hypothetical protein RI575_17905 [Balneolaceae bacterium]|nr:hypothetical protein [Balneolaceae bacterium]MDR9407667.1 hypothetical protein [Balneolaceae bacterium]
MNNVSKKDVDWLLNLHQKKPNQTKQDKTHSGLKRRFLWALIIFFGMIGLMILPFYLLVRTSVYLNLAYSTPAWIALGVGISITILLILIYMLLLLSRIKNRKLRFQVSAGSAGLIVFGFCLFSLFYLSGVNAKTEEVRDVYRSMHPILRVAISTVTLADGGLVITEIERVSDDYEAMGLPVNPHSLHYRQENGYVHAVDLRTRGHGLICNTLLQYSLEIMGFETLRHVGTADHLHVELAVN